MNGLGKQGNWAMDKGGRNAEVDDSNLIMAAGVSQGSGLENFDSANWRSPQLCKMCLSEVTGRAGPGLAASYQGPAGLWICGLR